jgi:O-antigen/teichoic acid export membrane protein
MNLARESFYTLLFQVASFLCATIAGIIIARTLGPANKGIISVTLLYPSLFFTVFNLTAGMGIIHNMGKRLYAIKYFAGSGLLILAVTSGFAILFFFTTIGPLRDILYKGVDARYLIIAGISIPFYLMLYYFSTILQGCMDIKGYNIANQFSSFSNLFFILIFVSVWKLTSLGAIIAALSGVIFGGLFSLFSVLKKSSGVSFDTKLTAILLTNGIQIHIGAIATFLFSQANIFILNYYAPPSEVGFYSVALNLANILLFFSISLEIGLYPKTAHASIEEAVKLVTIATRQIFLITAITALFLALCSKYIILVYGGTAFLPAMQPLLLLLPGVVLIVVPKILSTLWVRKGWFLPLTFIASGTALASLVFNMILIPTYGANGAAIATTLTYAFACLIALFLFWKYVSKDIFSLFVPQREDLALYKDIYGIFKGNVKI